MKKKMITILIVIVIASLLFIAMGFMAYNKIIPMALGIHNPVYTKDKVALEGYDVTTYFKDKLERGSATYSSTFMDVNWYFSSEENKDLFIANPGYFLPEYGGYCSIAVSAGFAAPADPSIYSIYKNKLYIFSNEEVRTEFLNDPGTIIAACSSKWK